MASYPRKDTPRGGVTLVEMLVVVSIMLLLAVVGIPIIRPILERQPVREAARAVSSYIEGAQIRARETGRPCGVWIERFRSQPQCAITVYQAESPAPYAGSETASAASLSFVSTSGSEAIYSVSFSTAYDGTTIGTFVSQGDKFQLNYQGPWYTVKSVAPSAVSVSLDTSTGATVNWFAAPSPSLPFLFLRQPVRSSARPLQLPAGTVIDLYSSGTPTASFEPAGPADETDVVIMFSPNGEAHSVGYFDRVGKSYTALFAPAGPMHLLIGRQDRLSQTIPSTGTDPRPSLADDGLLNVEDLNNLWVNIFPRNGLVTVAENAKLASKFNYANRLSDLETARQYAKQGQTVGGR